MDRLGQQELWLGVHVMVDVTYRPFPRYLLPYLERVEGERFHAYRDQGGVWTDGVGHTLNVTEGSVVSQVQIDANLASDLLTTEQRLYWAIGPSAIATLNDGEYAALLSFVFNEGEKADWAIWADIRQGDLSLVPSELAKFDIEDGKVDPGLVNRRKADIALWNGQAPEQRTAA